MSRTAYCVILPAMTVETGGLKAPTQGKLQQRALDFLRRRDFPSLSPLEQHVAFQAAALLVSEGRIGDGALYEKSVQKPPYGTTVSSDLNEDSVYDAIRALEKRGLLVYNEELEGFTLLLRGKGGNYPEQELPVHKKMKERISALARAKVLKALLDQPSP